MNKKLSKEKVELGKKFLEILKKKMDKKYVEVDVRYDDVYREGLDWLNSL